MEDKKANQSFIPKDILVLNKVAFQLHLSGLNKEKRKLKNILQFFWKKSVFYVKCKSFS